jgi:hypothetical protein
MRQVQEQRRVCNCGAYPFPHRHTGGSCCDPIKAELYYFGDDEDYRTELEAELYHSNYPEDDDSDTSFDPNEWTDEKEE